MAKKKALGRIRVRPSVARPIIQSPLRRRPYQFEASLPWVFAVGDVRSGSMKRVASAVGEGSAAVHLVPKVLAE